MVQACGHKGVHWSIIRGVNLWHKRERTGGRASIRHLCLMHILIGCNKSLTGDRVGQSRETRLLKHYGQSKKDLELEDFN